MSSVSPYQEHKGQICVQGRVIIQSDLNPDGYAGKPLWDKWVSGDKDSLLQTGGNGRTSLFILESIPEPHRSAIKAKWGNPTEIHNPLQAYFTLSIEAREFYRDKYLREDLTFLKTEQIDRYTVNASVLDALALLEQSRKSSRKSRGGSTTKIWTSLTNDVNHFNTYLQNKFGVRHTLPANERRLKIDFKQYKEIGYSYLIDGRDANKNAKVVSPLMLDLWQAIYAGQKKKKPTYTDVYVEYMRFLKGDIDIISNDTGEVYDHKSEHYKPCSEKTVQLHQSYWQNRIVSHSMRSGDKQRHSAQMFYHKLKQPEYAGSIISIDDRQPPFEYAPGERMWFYNGFDLGSEACTTWVYGDTKEGIIIDFYRTMVRNYAEWGLNIPYELEAEMALNSAYMDTFLKPGAMFQSTHIAANSARSKRVERYNRDLRYIFEKNEDGWKARPFARSEANQSGNYKVPILAKDEIVQIALSALERWNNTLHSNQKLHPGMTRWDVFMEKQHPNLKPTNWIDILRHLGKHQDTSMSQGRISLQGKRRVVGLNGEVVTGDRLIKIMSDIEGQDVDVYWLDDNHGEVLKAHVYDKSGRMICELLGDLEYSRSILERTISDAELRTLTSAYEKTVLSYINNMSKEVSRVTIIEKERPQAGRFQMPGLKKYVAPTAPAEEIEEREEVIHTTPAHTGNSLASTF